MKPLGAAVSSICIAIAMLLSVPLVAHAAAPELPDGLFGSQDPTYDGVFRQSEAILAYVAMDQTPPASAVQWLIDQQCANGSWQAYRADTAVPCPATDAANYTGPDSNSTALAVTALSAIKQSASANDGLAYLRTIQNDDGGMPYYQGQASDASSTGLTAVAVSTSGGSLGAFTQAGKSLRDGLNAFQIDCSATAVEQGGFVYVTSDEAFGSDFASVQGLLGLSDVGVPIGKPSSDNDQTNFACPDASPTTADRISAGAQWLVTKLAANNGTLASEYTPGQTDWTNTRVAVLALAASGHGQAAITTAIAALADSVKTTVKDSDGNDRPGVLAELILANQAAQPALAAKSSKGSLRALEATGGLDSTALLDRLATTLNTVSLGPIAYSGQGDEKGVSGSSAPELAQSGPSNSVRTTFSLALLLLALGIFFLSLSTAPVAQKP